MQDVMYANILQKFRNIGVDMLPPMDEESVYLKGVDLNQLTNGVHSVEALEMVKEHLMGMLGPQASNAYSNSLVRMSKLQAAQMYAASIMFGYFCVAPTNDSSLEPRRGHLPMNPSESAAALGRSSTPLPPWTPWTRRTPARTRGVSRRRNSPSTRTGPGPGPGPVRVRVRVRGSDGRGREHHLKQYIQSFDQQTLAETADRLPGGRGARGAPDRRALRLGGGTRARCNPRRGRGEPITTPDQLMERVQDVVGGGR